MLTTRAMTYTPRTALQDEVVIPTWTKNVTETIKVWNRLRLVHLIKAMGTRFEAKKPVPDGTPDREARLLSLLSRGTLGRVTEDGEYVAAFRQQLLLFL